MNKVPLISLNESVGHIHKISLTSFKMKRIFLAEDIFTLLAASIRNTMKILDFHESILELISN